MANVYQFPSDLSDSTEYGHMMVFTAYTPQSARAANLIRAGFTPVTNAVNNGQPLVNPQRQMLDQIYLYVPGGSQNNLTWAQAHEYEDIKMAGLATSAAAGVLGAISGVDPGTIAKAGQIAGGIFRTQINPYVEVLFRGTKLRAFDFSFMFAPQSAPDAAQLYGQYGILSRFRYHAAPEISGGGDGLLFKSPSEWEIDFLYRDGGNWAPNDKIPRIAKGVLTRVDVDYNPDTEFSSFENGAPTSARLTMRFTEMEIIDKTRILDGF